MYNLTVDEAHTFFVGEEQWLAHNDCPPVQEYLPGVYPPALHPGEGHVATYGRLIRGNQKHEFVGLEAHHMPSDSYMLRQLEANPDIGYTTNTGYAMNMLSARHAQTRSFRRRTDLSLTPRQSLAADILDVRRIYRQDDLYDSYIRNQLMEVIRRNREAFPTVFRKW